MMGVCSTLRDAVVFSGSLKESSLVEKKGITSAVLALHLVVVLCGTQTNRHCGEFLIVFVVGRVVAHDECCQWLHFPVLRIDVR